MPDKTNPLPGMERFLHTLRAVLRDVYEAGTMASLVYGDVDFGWEVLAGVGRQLVSEQCCEEIGAAAELRRLKEFLGDILIADWEQQRFDHHVRPSTQGGSTMQGSNTFAPLRNDAPFVGLDRPTARRTSEHDGPEECAPPPGLHLAGCPEPLQGAMCARGVSGRQFLQDKVDGLRRRAHYLEVLADALPKELTIQQDTALFELVANLRI